MCDDLFAMYSGKGGRNTCISQPVDRICVDSFSINRCNTITNKNLELYINITANSSHLIDRCHKAIHVCAFFSVTSQHYVSSLDVSDTNIWWVAEPSKNLASKSLSYLQILSSSIFAT